jgi:transcriptional regulator with XRE-family HTH domain
MAYASTAAVVREFEDSAFLDEVLASRIGVRLRALRLERGLTGEQLALRMGLPGFARSHVFRLEAGKHLATVRLLHRAAHALGVTLSELLEGVDEVRT